MLLRKNTLLLRIRLLLKIITWGEGALSRGTACTVNLSSVRLMLGELLTVCGRV